MWIDQGILGSSLKSTSHDQFIFSLTKCLATSEMAVNSDHGQWPIQTMYCSMVIH